MWLDAADINTFTPSNPTDGTGITQWSDKSGKSQHVTGITNALPVYTTNNQNGRSTVSFVGSKRFTFTPSGTFPVGTSPMSVFIAGKFGSSSTSQYFIVWGNGVNGGPSYYVNSTPLILHDYYGVYAGYTAATANTFYVISSTDTPGSINPYLMGTRFSTVTNVSYNIPSGWAGYIGDQGSTATFPLNGVIGEIIVYSVSLTAAQRQQVEGYLAWKWGVNSNLPTGHFSKPNPPAMRLFQAPDIGANLALWLDAADQSTLTLSGSNVTAWRDKSSNAYSFTGAAGGYPTYSNTIGGLPVVSSATGQRLSNTAWTTPSASATMFVVMKPGTLANNASCLLTDYPSGQVGFKTYYSYANQVNYYYYFQMFAAQNSSSGAFLFQSSLSNSGTFVPTTTVLITANIQGGPAHYVRYNGTQTATNVLNDARSIVAASNVTLAVAGALDTASSGYDLAEFIIYDGTMTTQQIKQVEGYLATKWKISANLPTTEPYYNNRLLANTALFSPVNLSNCAVWLDATDTTTFTFSTGSNVSQWRDKTASIAFTCANITLTTLSNYPALSNAGTGYMVNTSLNVASPYSIFVVANCRSNVDNYQRLVNGLAGAGGSTQNNVLFMGTNATNIATFIGNGSSFNDATSNTPISNVIGLTTLYSAVVNGTSVTPYTNANQSTVKTGSGSAATLTGLNLGGGQGTLTNSGSQTWPGHVMELLLYSRQLSAIERQQVEGYLAWKWRLQTLTPTSHPYYKFRA